MGDVFIERMVKKKFDTKDILIIVGIVLAVMVLMPILLLLSMQYGLFMNGLLAAAGLVFGGYKLLTMRMLEYEYSLTNGYISIDKIMNRSSRKRMTAFECSSAEDIGVYTQAEARLKNRSFDSRIFAVRTAACEGSWYMIVQSSKTGKTLVVFDPDEDLQEAIKKFIPRTLKFEVFGRNS